ncbi:uncharacterized protein LOC132644114 [Lycium barbarum]|uniref:uncharacterized protein LOC132644114 n=1 Tax=Lycium barbarum TaxID=112863 RepID=UPI00293E4D2F|nr:uncharacterized protein LOC132644114 [Lycium barbarum]
MPVPEDVDIEEGIRILFQEEDCYMILEECTETPNIREAEAGERLSNWTSTPLLALRNKNDKATLNVMICCETNESDSVSEEEYKEYDETTMLPEGLTEEVEQLENEKKPNLDEMETINLGDEENVKERRISAHLDATLKEELISLLREYVDVFAWSYADMPGLSISIVSHKLPINEGFSPIKQKTRQFKPDLSIQIKDEMEKQIESGVVEIYGDLIRVPPSELSAMSSPWPFVALGIDVIGPIEPAASNGHQFILVAIDYFTKWVEATSHKLVIKKVVPDFVRNHIICRFGIPESVIMDNGANLNNHLMKDICEQFKITHQISTAYQPQMNRAIEAANKNIKRILRKMIDNHKGWHEQ